MTGGNESWLDLGSQNERLVVPLADQDERLVDPQVARQAGLPVAPRPLRLSALRRASPRISSPCRPAPLRSHFAGLPAEAASAASVPRRLVGTGGLEPPTSCMSSRRSNQLSYMPM